MKISVRLWVVALLALMATQAVAALRDQAAAHDIATMELNRPRPGRQLAHVGTVRLAHVERSSSSPAVAYYVFNASDGSAFVIVGGDDRVPPVLGYGDGAVDMASLPCAMQWLLDNYKRQMEWLHAHPGAAVEHAALRQSVAVAPMLTTTWGQRIPYNNMCPVLNGQPCVTGCVATAMAQVMNYWKFPVKAPAIAGYKTSTNMMTVPALPQVELDWDNMLDSYPAGGYNDAQAAAVATLMRYCGQACKMDYGIASSMSWVGNQLDGMKLLRYNRDAEYVTRMDYSDEAWLSLLLDELTGERPVLYLGHGNRGSHAFVIDGYDGEKFHINWGWNGLADGYFALGAFNAVGYTLNEGQQMIVQLYPDPIERPYDFADGGIYYKITSASTVSVTSDGPKGNTYSGDVTLPSSVTFKKTVYQVTGLDDGAFKNCETLTAVTLPATLTTIGNGAFAGCKALTGLSIPASVEHIGSAVFSGCTSLVSMALPAAISCLGDSLFHGCKALTDVSLPATLTAMGDATFSGCTALSGVSLPQSLTSMGNATFRGCSLLASVSLPPGLTVVGEFTFTNCRSLTSVMIPGSVTSIRHNSFEGCTSLEDLTIPPGVVSIGGAAFQGCTALTSLLLPDGLTEIMPSTFYDCTKLSDINIPATVTRIGEKAFYKCTGIKRLSMPSSVTTVGANAFYGCNAIRRVYAHDIASWCAIAFANQHANPLQSFCGFYIGGEKVTHLVIPEGVTSIGDYAFISSDSIVTVTLPSTLVHVGTDAFAGCGNLYRVFITDLAAWCEIDFSSAKANPLHYAHHLFLGGVDMDQLTVPDDVKHIGNYAFFGANALRTVTLGAAVTSIGRSAFEGCFDIRSVSFQDSVRFIGADAFKSSPLLTNVDISDPAAWPLISFENAYSNPLYFAHVLNAHGAPVETIIFPDTLTAVPAYAFAQCKSLKRAVLSPSIRYVGQYAFDGSGLADLTITGSLTKIGKQAFYCPSLERLCTDDLQAWCNIEYEDEYSNPLCNAVKGVHLLVNDEEIFDLVIPEGTTIGEYGKFSNLAYLTSIVVPGGVTAIGNGAFARCRSLQSLSLPNGLRKIGGSAFYDCSALPYLAIPNTVTTVGTGIFELCASLDSVSLSSSMTTVPNSTFLNCRGLKRVVIPDAVKVIEAYALEGCSSLREVVIGKGVEQIGFSYANRTFAQCDSIESITCRASTPPSVLGIKDMGQYAPEAAFSDSVYTHATLYVPKQSLEAYHAAAVWSLFQHIEGIDVPVDQQPGDVNADGSVNIADVNTLIQVILSGGNAGDCDVNGDGTVNITDVNAVINLIIGH